MKGGEMPGGEDAEHAETPTDEQPVVLQEHVTLRKFDGDPPAPGETKEPVETIVLVDGVIVEHIVGHQEEKPHGSD
jgi:hypothetical protein